MIYHQRRQTKNGCMIVYVIIHGQYFRLTHNDVLKMDLYNAIFNLNHANEEVRLTAISVCKNFQNPLVFDWNIWLKLSDSSNQPIIRLFAYNTLTNIMESGWSLLQPDLQTIIFQSFPFFNVNSFFNDPIKDTIIHTCAVFFLYDAPLNNAIQYFPSSNDNEFLFSSSLLAEFIEIFRTALPPERLTIFNSFFESQMFLELFLKFLVQPIQSYQIESNEFLFFISLLGKVHKDSACIMNVIINHQEILDVYSTFASLVWLPTNDLSVVYIIDSVLTIEQLQCNSLLKALAESALNSFLQNFHELFENNITENYSFLLDNFIARIPIFFKLLDKFDLNSLFPFFSMVIVMFKSLVPSIIYEISDHINSFLKKFAFQPGFIELFFQLRMELFEACIYLLTLNLNKLPGANYDTNLDEKVISKSIFSLCLTICEIDSESVTKYLIKKIVSSDTNESFLQVYVKILSASLSPDIHLSEEFFFLSVFLLQYHTNASEKLKEHIFNLLTKLIPYLDLSNEQLNEYFSCMINIFFKIKPNSLDPFSSYLITFVNHFSPSIIMPIEEMEKITNDDPCYYTISTILSRYNGNEKPLYSALNDIECFLNNEHMNFQDFQTVSQVISRSFEFIYQNPPSDSSFALSLLLKLISCSNILVNILNNITNDKEVNSMLSPFSYLSKAIAALAYLVPNAYQQILDQLHPPTIINRVSNLWIKQIALPILKKVQSYLQTTVIVENSTAYQIGIQLISHYSTLLCFHFIPFIEKIEEIPNSETNQENEIKKLAIQLCKICCFIIKDDDIILILNVCLKLDDFRIFSSAIDTSIEKGIHIFSKLWTCLTEKVDNRKSDKLIGALYIFYEKANLNLSQFKYFFDFTEEQLNFLSSKLANCENPKTKRRYFRTLLPH